MAPFNKFAKKLHLDKKSSSSNNNNNNNNNNGNLSNKSPNTSVSNITNGTGSSVANGSFVNNSFSNTSFNQESPNQQFKSNNVLPRSQQVSNNSFPVPDTRNQNAPNLQQQQQQQPQQMRVFPTPQPPQQRNVSGAVTTLSYQQKEYTPWNRIKLLNSPFPRYRHVASSYESKDNEIFVIGGLNNQSVYGDTWILKSDNNGEQFFSKAIEITDMAPPPRVGHAATLCGNAFILFGGDTHKVNKDGLMDDDLYLFNINSHKWTIPNPTGPRPLGRYGHKISIIAKSPTKTKLYIFGGQFDDTYFNDLAVFDLSSFRRTDSHWEFIKAKGTLPPPITNHTMVSYDHKLWIFGGDTQNGLSNDIYTFDPYDNNCWTKINATGDIPVPVQEHSAIVYNNLMCVVGGKDGNDMYLNSVHFFNFESLKWYKFPIFKAGIIQGRSGHSITLLNSNKLLIMGGDKYDYARPSEYDLHTADTDQGAGTIVYTLDLSRLEKLCPHINEKALNSTDTTTQSFGTQNTPPNNKDAPAFGTFLPSTPLVNKNISPGGQNDMSLAVGNDQNIILTPYQDNLVSTPSKHPADVSKEEDESYTNITDQSIVLAPPHINAQEANKSTQLEESTNKKDVLIKAPEIDNEANHSHSNMYDSITDLSEDYLGTATVATSPDKGSVKYDYQETNKAEELSDSNVSKVKRDSIEKLPDTKNIALSTGALINPGLNESQTSKIYIEKSIIEELRNQVEAIKLETEKSAKEASDHIHELESENEILKTNSSKALNHNETKLKLRCEVLEADVKALQDKNKELELLIDASFLDVSHLNGVIKRQSQKLSELDDVQGVQQNYKELESKYHFLIQENESLKDKLEEIDGLGFNKNVNAYSSKLDEMIDHWKNSKLPTVIESPNPNSDNRHVASSRYHKQVISNLSTKLDDLLDKSTDLLQTKEKLSTDYKSLEMKHSSLSQEFFQKQSELEKAEINYKNTLNSMQDKTKELQDVRLENKTLKEELKKLKLSGST